MGKEFLGTSDVESEGWGERYGTRERRIAVCVHGRGRKRKGEGKRERRGNDLERGVLSQVRAEVGGEASQALF